MNDIVHELYLKAKANKVRPKDLINLGLGRTTAYNFYSGKKREYSAGTINIIRQAIEMRGGES